MVKIILLYVFVSLIVIGCTKKEVIYQKEEIEDSLEYRQQYIVVLKKSSDVTLSSAQIKKSFESFEHSLNLKAKKVFSKTISAVVSELSRSELIVLRKNKNIDFIERDDFLTINLVQNQPPYNLDRIDQTDLPLDGLHAILELENAVNTYVIDTGVLVSHDDFEGRALHGFDFVDNDADASDCNGHGTHVAGTLAGTTYGVAKTAKIYGVRVLDCFGRGQFSDVIAGIEWVTENHMQPAVANMSLGGGVSLSIDQAIEASVQSGVTYIVAAGNESRDACNSSPARVASAVTVGSTTITDSLSSFSNTGECVDIFAPGTDILSAWSNSDSSTRTISGTSMASPLVAGVAALYLSKNPMATPAEVKNAVVNGANMDRIVGLDANSPNRLVSAQFLVDDESETDPIDDEINSPAQEEELKNNQTIGDLSGTLGDELLFFVDIIEGTTTLSVQIFGGSGDADLYLKAGAKASRLDFDCRPFRFGNEELCEISDPKAGRYYIMLRAYSNFSKLNLSVLF